MPERGRFHRVSCSLLCLLAALALPAALRAQTMDASPDASGSGVDSRLLPALDCSTFQDPGGVDPLTFSPDPDHHYFWYRNRPLVLVGASADTGCALQPPIPQSSSATCNSGNYASVLDAAAAAGLNKIGLWVAITGDSVGADSPFLWRPAPPASAANATPYWDLDTMNPGYFRRLVSVVDDARQKGLFVEVTFFAPFQGNSIATGPWIDTGMHRSRATINGVLSDVGFSDPRYFVLLNGDDSDPRLPASQRRMSVYQRNVIDWTVDALWCFDNVYWEIANEPDGGWNRMGVDPEYVAGWEKQRIAEVRAREEMHPLLRHGHLIAVQSLSTASALALLPPDEPAPASPWSLPAQVLNGHYTTVSVLERGSFPGSGSSFSGLDLGAISMLHQYDQKPMIFGFNETKITGARVGGPQGTASHENDVRKMGTLEPVRAEALEFLFSQGAAYDHHGYLQGNVAPAPVRQMLGRARLFFNPKQAGAFEITPLQLTDFKAMATAASQPGWTAWSSWFQPGAYPSDWDATTASKRYWAALETKPGVSPRALLYYVHHSTPRCKSGEYEVNGCPDGPISFGGYDARLWTRPLQYQESIHLTLGSFTGRYDLTWIDPATLQPLPGKSSHLTTVWNGQTCTGLDECTIPSPKYPFDIILRVYKIP